MRRACLATLFALAVASAAVAPAAAAPHNKNTALVQTQCDNGHNYTVRVNERSNINGAVHVEGVGPVKVVSLTAFEQGTSNVLFSDRSNFPKPANVTCTGTITEVDPDTGEPFTFDFEVTVYLKRG
jgi:hypothetical protein